jgi:hypothetical protein
MGEDRGVVFAVEGEGVFRLVEDIAGYSVAADIPDTKTGVTGCILRGT